MFLTLSHRRQGTIAIALAAAFAVNSLEAAEPLALTPKATDLYVSTAGDDSAAGGIAAPFRTINKAMSAIRAKSHSAPITVWVRAGTYFLEKPLQFGPADSGTADAPITFAAYPNESVTLSGGIPLHTAWSPYAPNPQIQVAHVGPGLNFDMLFLNSDKLLTLARYPNYDASKVPLQGCANISDRIARWANPAGGFIRAMHTSGWGSESFRITGKTGDKLTLDWVGDNNRGSVANQNRQVAENIFEELDAPGEWFYNPATGDLFLYPPADCDLAKSTFIGAGREELLRFVGAPSDKVKYLTFSGFTFTHTHRTLFTSTYEGLSQGDWAIARKAAVFMQDAEHVAITDSAFLNLGGNGVFMSGYNQDNTVSGCDFAHIGATAVAIVGLPSSTQFYCTWENNKQVPTNLIPGPASEDYPRHININHCYMFDNGMFEKQTAAVFISMSQAVTVSHCTAHYGPRSGINVEDGTFGGHLIEFNDVFDEVRETSDHGPFNSWGRDRWWNRFTGDDARKYALLDVVDPITIRNNRFYNSPGHASYGIDLDDGSTNYQISNNLLVNCGFKSQHGFNHTVDNNILINALGTFHQWNLPDMQKNVTHNIIVNKNPYYCRTRDFKPNTGTIDFNLFWNNGDPVAMQIDSGNGRISAAATWARYHLDEHSLTADPQFVDPARGNYTVKDTSPALKLGFKNFPMDQFGKPGYPVPPGFQKTKPQSPVRIPLPDTTTPKSDPKVDLGPLDVP